MDQKTKKSKRIERALKIKNNAVAFEFDRVDESLEELETIVKQLSDLAGLPNQEDLKGVFFKKLNNFFESIKDELRGGKGDPGNDYVLTEKDKKEIAKSVTVPVVERVIERTEVIKEQPIITNEIKEVAVADTAEDIRNKLELLNGDERLKIEAIRDLRDELDKLRRKEVQPILVGGGGSSGGGKTMKVYDLSSQLNGVLKTFNLPAFWRVISVHSSSFPNAFRPTTDYTTDASAMTITFTSEIGASTTLATGQTLIVTYAE